MSASSRTTRVPNPQMRNETGIEIEELPSHKKEEMRKISDVSNSINNICVKLFGLVKMKVGQDSSPNSITQEKDVAIEREFGKALENFETECDTLSNDIEMDKKDFINSFIKYGADNSINDKLISEYNEKREENFKNILHELGDVKKGLEDGFV